MTSKQLVYKIVNSILDEGANDVHNYTNALEQGDHLAKIIQKELDRYLIIQGEVLD